MKSRITIFLFLCIFPLINYAQSDSIEVYLIDAYSTTEIPYKFKLSFYTSEPCLSKVILEDKYDYEVSTEMTDMHKTEIDLSKLSFKGKTVNFVIITQNENGDKFTSEVFDFDLPYEPQFKEESNFVYLCLFGGTVFLLPYPNLILANGDSHFSLTKDIPIVSLRSKSLRYPAGYFSIEYSHIFDVTKGNYLRTGYKQIFEPGMIEYISPGITVFTNFSGNNGVAPEISFGLFRLLDSFTVYARYRYNINPGNSSANFNEISIGLYSSFFSFYLN
jgi:hypothetical protein